MFEIIILPGLLALATYKMGILDTKGSLSAFFLALLMLYVGGLNWLAIMFAFLLAGYAATRWKYDEKKKLGVEEFHGGVRGAGSVLANGFPPLFFVLILSPVGFLGAVATALSDTLASEIGSTSGNARLITGMKRVKPGTEGAISPLGTFASIIGAFIIASLGPLIGVGPKGSFAAFLAGVAGCKADSLLGATLETKGMLGKNHVNFISTFLGGFLAVYLSGVL